MSVKALNTSVDISTTANGPTTPGIFSAFGRSKRLSEQAGTVRPIFRLNDSSFSQYVYLNIDSAANRILVAAVGRTSGDLGLGSAVLPVGSWYAWYVSCAGTGTNQLKVGVRVDGAGSWTSLTMDGPTGLTFFRTAITFNSANFTDAEYRYWRMWDAALTESEFTAELSSATAVRTANILRDHRLDNAASAAVDSSGNGFNLNSVANVADGASEPILLSSNEIIMGAMCL